jgi:hypothetical protein
MQPLDVDDEGDMAMTTRRGRRLFPESEIGCILVAGFAIVIMAAAAIFFTWVGTYVATTKTAPSLSTTIISAAPAVAPSGLFLLVLTLFLRLLV